MSVTEASGASGLKQSAQAAAVSEASERNRSI